MSVQEGSLSLLTLSVFIPNLVLAARWVTSNSANSGRFGRAPPPPLPSPHPFPSSTPSFFLWGRWVTDRWDYLAFRTLAIVVNAGDITPLQPRSLLHFSLTPPWEIWQEILIKVWNLQNNKARVFNIHICQFDSKPISSQSHFFKKSLMLLFYISVSFFLWCWSPTMHSREETKPPALGEAFKTSTLVIVSLLPWSTVASICHLLSQRHKKICISRVPFVKSTDSPTCISWYLEGCFW